MAFSNKHLDEMKIQMERTIEQTYLKMQEDKQKDVMKYLGEDMYDYSDIENLGINENFIDGEFIVIQEHLRQYGMNGGTRETSSVILIITNYARISYKIESTNSWKDPQQQQEILNFWIPKDYIFCLQKICSCYSEIKPEINSGCNFTLHTIINKILNVIKHLKENLENGKYVKNNVDIHFMDVYAKNQQLIKDKSESEKIKQTQEADINAKYKQLQLDTDELDKQKEHNRLVVAKIKHEQMKLNREKQDFEKHMLDNTNIDDFMNDNLSPAYNSKQTNVI
jgi:hypothetical protein